MLIDLDKMLCLLPGFNFIILAFGPEMKPIPNGGNHHFQKSLVSFAQSHDGFKASASEKTGNWALMECFGKLYSEQTVKSILPKYRIPDVLIGLNAGFMAHQRELRPVIEYVRRSNILSVFTEWALQDMYMYEDNDFIFDVNYVPNPFRSPMIIPHENVRFHSTQNSHFCANGVKI